MNMKKMKVSFTFLILFMFAFTFTFMITQPQVAHAGASISVKTYSSQAVSASTNNFLPVYYGTSGIMWMGEVYYSTGSWPCVYSFDLGSYAFCAYGNSISSLTTVVNQIGSVNYANVSVDDYNAIGKGSTQTYTSGSSLSYQQYVQNGLISNSSINTHWFMYINNDSYQNVNGQQIITQQAGSYWEICNTNSLKLYFQGGLIYSATAGVNNIGCYMWSGLTYMTHSTNYVPINPMWIQTVYSGGCQGSTGCSGDPHSYLYYLVGLYTPFSQSGNSYFFDTQHYGYIDMLQYQNDTVQIWDGNNYITIFDQTKNTLNVYQKSIALPDKPFLSITFSGSNVIENMVGIYIQYRDSTNMYVGYLTNTGITLLDTEPLTAIQCWRLLATSSYNQTGSSSSCYLVGPSNSPHDYAVAISPYGGSFYEYLSTASQLISTSPQYVYSVAFTVRIITVTPVTPQPVVQLQTTGTNYVASVVNDIGNTLEWGLANAPSLPATWTSNNYPQYVAITSANQVFASGTLPPSGSYVYLWARNYGSFGFSNWIVYTINGTGYMTNSTPQQSGSNTPSGAFSLSVSTSTSTIPPNTFITVTPSINGGSGALKNITYNFGSSYVQGSGFSITSGVYTTTSLAPITFAYTNTGVMQFYAAAWDTAGDETTSNVISFNVTTAGSGLTLDNVSITLFPNQSAVYPVTASLTLNVKGYNHPVNFTVNWGDNVSNVYSSNTYLSCSNFWTLFSSPQIWTCTVQHTYTKSGLYSPHGLMIDSKGFTYPLAGVSIAIANNNATSNSGSSLNVGSNLQSIFVNLGFNIGDASALLSLILIAACSIGIMLVLGDTKMHVNPIFGGAIGMFLGSGLSLVFFGVSVLWVVVLMGILGAVMLMWSVRSVNTSAPV